MSLIELDKKAYFWNLDILSKKAGGADKIIAVLKDNAYGHGARLVASMAREFGIKFAVVKNEREAYEIDEFFDEILILSHIPTGLESQKFTYAINDLSQISKLKKGTKVHIALDTLMSRNGIKFADLQTTLDEIQKYGLILRGAYTHFRCADEIGGDFFTQKQNYIKAKLALKTLAKDQGINSLVFHSCNSAATQRSEIIDDDFIRVGIAQFGYEQFNSISFGKSLKPVLKLYADKISQRVLKKGEKIGYGGVYEASENIDIVTYDLGYGDGLFRCDKSINPLLAGGKLILGKMSMDSFSSPDYGKRVCVIDDARMFAKAFHTIEYEILVKLSPFIKRVII
ncbi:MAG: alanine racemase [Campylobacter sp.]|nr:alanine racemase [Campylobacter sp.]